MDNSILTPQQVQALVHAATATREPLRDLAVLTLCLDAGTRRAELVSARRSDFKADHGVLVLGSGPSCRILRLGDTAWAALRAASPARADGPLLVAHDGRPLTERAVHEQLLTISSLAGLGHWLTTRDARRTFITSVARVHPLTVAMRLSGHGNKRCPPATAGVALAAQFRPGWVSPLDALLRTGTEQRAA